MEVRTYMGLPREQIEEAAKIYTGKIPVRIQRRAAHTGRFATIGTFQFPPAEIIDIESWLKENFGGGSFACQPKHPDNHFTHAAPLPQQFILDIEAPPKPATARDFNIPSGPSTREISEILKSVESSGGPMIEDRDITAADFAALPEWTQSLSMQDKIDFIRQVKTKRHAVVSALGLTPQQAPNPAPSPPPSQVVVPDPSMAKHADYVAAALEAEREKAAFREAKLHAQLEEMNKRLDQERIERARVDAEARERALKVEIEALRNQMSAMADRKPSPAFDPEMLKIAIPAGMAFLTAMMQSNAQKQQTLVEQQTKSHQLQMEAVNALLTRQQPQQDSTKQLLEMLVGLFPAVAPLVKEFMDSKSPKAQAELYHDMVESQLNSMTMIASLTEQLAKSGGQDPWYMPIVQNGIQSVLQLTESLAKAQRTQIPIPKGANGASMAVSPPEIPGRPAQAPQNAAQQGEYTPGQRVASMVMQNPGFPADMRKPEWFNVLSQLHDHVDSDRVADLIMNTLDAGVPETLLQAGFNENPIQAIAKILSVLPVSQNKPYVEAVLKDCVAWLEQASSEDEDEETDEDDDEETAEEETDEAPVVPFNIGQPFESPAPMMAKSRG
jgi:hypothetical protein